MSHIVTFCDKIIKERNNKIDQRDFILKTKLEKAEKKEIQKTIRTNETATKKNYVNVSSNPKPPVKVTNITHENGNLKKATHVEILRANKTPTKGLIKTNNTNHNKKPIIQQKLRLLCPINRLRRQGNNPSRKLSNSNIKSNKNMNENLMKYSKK